MLEFEISKSVIDFSLRLEGEFALLLALIVGFLFAIGIRYLFKEKDVKNE